MKRGPVFYPEDELVAKHQSGEYTWVDYISHHSEEWCDEYEEFCKKHNFDEDDETAAKQFVEKKDEDLEKAIEAGEA